MSTLSHQPSRAVEEKRRWTEVVVRETWASLAISVMWLAVLFDAVFGPDIVSSSGGPTGTSSTVPSAVVVAPFAFLGTWVVSKYAFGRERDD